MKDIPGKGRGLVAKSTLEPGSILFYDNMPLFLLRPPLNLEEIEWPDKYEGLRSLNHKAWPDTSWSLYFRDLHNAFPGRAERPELGIYRTNRVPACEERESVWRLVSLLNHSCVPNAFYCSWGNGHAEVHIIKRVAPGEEITRCYTPTVGIQRRKELKEVFGFECICSACKPVPNGLVRPMFGPVHEDSVPEDKDASYRELFETVSGLIVKAKELKLPHQTLFLAGLGSKLLERLGIVDERYTGMLEEAFRVTATQKDMRRAKLFAELIVNRQEICLGKDSFKPEIKTARKMVECPTEFAGSYSPKNWEVRENDRPRLNTILEQHIWLWRIDYPHDITSLRSSLPWLAAIIPKGLRILAGSPPIAWSRLTPEEQARVESFGTQM